MPSGNPAHTDFLRQSMYFELPELAVTYVVIKTFQI
jgi:hypothetical protein